MNQTPAYRLLGRLDDPADLRALPAAELPAVALEMRRFLIETIGRVGGHFAASLGTVELTLALHYLLDTPRDALLWDVGHQAYGHKMLTGRRALLDSIRHDGGLAPFPERAESPYDIFGTGHSSTALSAAAGIAAARRMLGAGGRIVAVIGDGGLTAGMAFEALNHIGAQRLPMLIVLNDNDMSISENVGGLRDRIARGLGRPAPPHAPVTADLADWFAAMGIDYRGPVDGHDLPALLDHLAALRDTGRPTVLHALTVKGKGFAEAEAAPIRWHAVPGFDPVTGSLPGHTASAAPSCTEVFGNWLCAAASDDASIAAVTPAMREGSGLVDFAARFPQRFFDVGIAEQHAVTFAAGLAAQGMRPVMAIYSTFLQRAYDQLIHDVAVQRLPVLFAVDRGGLVGGDGATHQGAFDHACLRAVPNMTVMAPADARDLRAMLDLGLRLDGPSAVRYPKSTFAETLGQPAAVEPGRARHLRSARGQRDRVALLAFGSMVAPALEAAELLDASVWDMRFVKPLDTDAIAAAAAGHSLLVSIEEAAVTGGAGDGIAAELAARATETPLLRLGIPDRFIPHGSRDQQLRACGLDSAGIQRAVYAQLRARHRGSDTGTQDAERHRREGS